MSLSEDLKKKSNDELAKFQAEIRGRAEYEILIEKEWERRARIKQHELDTKLISKQVRSMKFAAIVGVIATLLGAILGAIIAPWLQSKLSTQTLINKKQTDKQQIAPAVPVYHIRDSNKLSQGKEKK